MPLELIRSGTHIDFIGKRHICVAVSIAILLAGVVAAFVKGPKFGIDFAGGTEIQFRFPGGADDGAIRSIVTGCGVTEPAVFRYGDDFDFMVRFQATPEIVAAAAEACPVPPDAEAELVAAREAGQEENDRGEIVDRLTFALANGIGPVSAERVEYVGPRVGAELRRDGLSALALACLAILVYIGFRFSARFAPGAIVALVHDIGITAGLFVIFGLEFDLRVLAALLAILGYSLNDTIIIYDRIRENMAIRTKYDLVDVLNRSVNQTLSRTVLTSGTTMAVVLALLFLGGEVIRPFAIAMVIGIVVGTYSSVFIAAPTLLFLENYFGDGDGDGKTQSKPAKKSRTLEAAL